MNTVRQFIENWRQRFDGAGIEDARLNVELLVAHVLGVSRGGVKARLDESLDLAHEAAIETLCDRRLSREPVDYILGEREFFGRKFQVQPGVLIPRPETEQIIELAQRQISADIQGWAADIGCGSGALAVTLALEFPRLRVLATDLHPVPLVVTRRNAVALGVADRVFCARMDGLSAISPAPLFDLIVSNPPYVTPQDYPTLQPEVRDHEPKEALVGGVGGVEILERLIGEVAVRLKAGASCYFEHGMEQGSELREAAARAGLAQPHTEKDPAGRDRILVARRLPMDFYALVTLEFDDSVDHISRAMFAERLAEYSWRKLPGGWVIEFEARSRHGRDGMVENQLKLACQYARFERAALNASVTFSENEPPQA